MTCFHPDWIEGQRQRWMRPDWQRLAARDARQQRQDQWMREVAIERARRELDALRFQLFLLRYEALRRKANFNPNQPRVPAGDPEGGQWTDAGGGQWTREGLNSESGSEFRPDKPGWHDYTAGPNLICRAELRCSRREIADQIARFAVPGQDPSRPVENGKKYKVYDPVFGTYAGNVSVTISDDGLAVTNQTLPGHVFYDGQVTRSATMAADGSWYVTTRGIGNNVNFGRNIINELAGPGIFELVDDRMRSNIRAHHGKSANYDMSAQHHNSGATDCAFRCGAHAGGLHVR